MKKSYLVFSDVHGDKLSLFKLKELAKEHDGVIFAGDGLSGLKDFTDKPLYVVGGNCDFGGAPEIVTSIDGVRILITHGHRYGVKTSPLSLSLRARELMCDVAIFGHTHDLLCAYEGGVFMLNPGASSGHGRKTYAVLYIDGKKLDANIFTL
jgi:putative phosphoesterase